MVQVNYPYATNFEAPLPAWPNKAACAAAAQATEELAEEYEFVRANGGYDWSNVDAIAAAYNVWTQVGHTHNGKLVECVNFDGSA